MDDFMPVLSAVLPLVASSLLVIVLTVHCYLKIKRKFPVSVNCWFCNSWTKVSYDDRKSFDCASCLQYNGFTKDGDYDKIIPEQHDEFMNNSKATIKTKHNVNSNGLCTLCNNNQQLKIFQLAHFVPMVDDNYDNEIEHFQEQLEKAYKLCKKCDKTLKNTINKQNAWMFGKRLKGLCNNGLSAINKVSININAKRSIIIHINNFVSLMTGILMLGIVMTSSRPLINSLSAYVPATYLPLFTDFSNVIQLLHTAQVTNFRGYLLKSVKIQPFIAACGLGLSTTVVAFICDSYSVTVKLNRLLCWTILLLTSWIHGKSMFTFILTIQFFASFYLVCSSYNKQEEHTSPTKLRNKSVNRFIRSLEKTVSEFSDEDISSSSKTIATNLSNCSHGSLDDLNKSVYSTKSHFSVPLTHNVNTASSFRPSSTFGQSHCGFTTARSVASGAKSCSSFDSDLNHSLSNLHLGSLDLKSPSYSVTSVKRPRPVLSPPKLQAINSWVAKNTENPAQRSNLSRSSSESSGFGSQKNWGDYEKSDFAKYKSPSVQDSYNNYLFSPIQTSQDLNKHIDFRNNTFYPNLHQHNMLYIQGNRNFVRSPNLLPGNNAVFFSGGAAKDTYRGASLFQTWPERMHSQPTQSFGDLTLRTDNGLFKM